MANKNDKWSIKQLPNKDFQVVKEEKPQDKRDKDEEDISKYCSPDSPTAD